MSILRASCLAALVAGGVFTSAASAGDAPGRVLAGWVERVELLPWAMSMKAKLDTGAATSSLHATDIERIERDGRTIVAFTVDHPALKDSRRIEAPVQRHVRIKDHDDASARRPVVSLMLCFDGREHDVQFTLADRSKFVYPMLLGRRFLEGTAVVDPSNTFQTLSHCE